MPAYYNEWDPYCAQWLRNLIAAGHIPAGDVDERSIADVHHDDLVGYRQCHFFAGLAGWPYALQLAGWPDGREVWTGSCPCQPFSVAGQRKGSEDARHLWPKFFQLIAKRRPSTIFGEQVSGRMGLEWLAAVRTDLEAIGYAIGAADLPACSVGAPHIRRRLFWVAHSECSGSGTGRTGEARGSSPVKPDRHGAAIGLASSEHGGCEGWNAQRSWTGSIVPSGQGAGELGGAWREGRGQVGSDARRRGERSGAEGLAERPLYERNVNPWSDLQWLPCIDGKWRPVGARLQYVASRLPTGMAAGSANKEHSEIDNGAAQASRCTEPLQGVRSVDAAENVRVGTGRSGCISSPQILRSGVHGGGNDWCHQGSERTHLAQPSEAVCEAEMRGLRKERQAAVCSPQRREPAEQRGVEFADFVRLLPSAGAFAELHGDTDTTQALHALFESCGQGWPLQHARSAPPEVWRPFVEQNQDRIRVEIAAGGWVIGHISPLTKNVSARVGKLRAAGNAIVPPLAAEFIKAFMECSP